MSPGDDELEARLHALFADERLNVQPPASAETAIVSGARRRRRRRVVLAGGSGVLAATALAAVGVLVTANRAEQPTMASGTGQGTVPTFAAPPTTGPSPGATVPPPASGVPLPSPSTGHDGEGTPSRVPTSPPPATPPSFRPMRLSGPQLGPDGYGGLKLGMTTAQVTAQGITLGPPAGGNACKTYTFSGADVPTSGSVLISPDTGVALIQPDGTAVTPEGVGRGSAIGDVMAAYPGASPAQNEGRTIYAPANPSATYVFGMDGTGEEVDSVELQSDDQDCAG